MTVTNDRAPGAEAERVARLAAAAFGRADERSGPVTDAPRFERKRNPKRKHRRTLSVAEMTAAQRQAYRDTIAGPFKKAIINASGEGSYKAVALSIQRSLLHAHSVEIGYAFPSASAIAKDIGISPRQAKRHVAHMIERGDFFAVVPGSVFRSNRYWAMLDGKPVHTVAAALPANTVPLAEALKRQADAVAQQAVYTQQAEVAKRISRLFPAICLRLNIEPHALPGFKIAAEAIRPHIVTLDDTKRLDREIFIREYRKHLAWVAANGYAGARLAAGPLAELDDQIMLAEIGGPAVASRKP